VNRLSGRVVVVAGGSAGMGRVTAARCAAEGASVVILARGAERLAEACGSIGDAALGIPCDISDPVSVKAAFATIGERFGHIDALLNIAGIARVRTIEEASDEDIAAVFGTNLLGPVFTTRSAVPLLRKAGGGDIINVSSEITGDYLPYMVLYGASKGGLDVFSRMMVHELKPDNIRISNYVSGTVAGTDFVDNFTQADMEKAIPSWMESGYLTRVAGPGMDMEWMAEMFVLILTRPQGQMIDLIHVRSSGTGATVVPE
jgi:NAD(P)-dependent dehydrogenase (short-subunit alcohol dehydrogenase family)